MIFGSIATLLTGCRTWDRENAKNPGTEKRKRGGRGTATDEVAYRITFAINEAMLFQLLGTIAVICWTTIRPIDSNGRSLVKISCETKNRKRHFMIIKYTRERSTEKYFFSGESRTEINFAKVFNYFLLKILLQWNLNQNF